MSELPLVDSDWLVRIVEADPAFPERFPHLTPGDFVDLREQTRGFSGIAAGQSNIQTIVEPGEPEELPGMMVSDRYFETLGARLVLGRSFTDADYVEANIDFSRSAVAARLDERAKGHPLVRSVILISTNCGSGVFSGSLTSLASSSGSPAASWWRSSASWGPR